MDVERVLMQNPHAVAQKARQTSTVKENKAGKRLENTQEVDYNDSTVSDKIREHTDKKTEKQNSENNEDPISKVVEDANKLLKGSRRNLEYSIHDATQQVMVKVVNTDTGEIIREIPPEKALDIMAKIWELAGLFVDEKS